MMMLLLLLLLLFSMPAKGVSPRIMCPVMAPVYGAVIKRARDRAAPEQRFKYIYIGVYKTYK